MKKLSIILLVAIVLIMTGCATTPKPKPIIYSKEKAAFLADGTEAQQVKGNITLIVNPMNVLQELEKPVYTQTVEYNYIPYLSLDGSVQRSSTKLLMPFFDGMTAFEVTIINNTDHILRMNDSRIAYIDPNSDDPIRALRASDININQLNIYKETVELMQQKFKPVDNYYIQSINTAINNIIAEQKLINAFDKEILPGMKSSGKLLIPLSPEQISEGVLSFIDIVATTDKAGNPTEKVRFDYRIKAKNVYSKFDGNVSNKWIEISEEEYNTGMASQKIQ